MRVPCPEGISGTVLDKRHNMFHFRMDRIQSHHLLTDLLASSLASYVCTIARLIGDHHRSSYQGCSKEGYPYKTSPFVQSAFLGMNLFRKCIEM
mmetsp:Transcript_1307/g.1834  ORF Transcript_1307/g.1834 Transcript_1307/m.1834 type:complete len:94 (-) Transcript_1307:67-348(-)